MILGRVQREGPQCRISERDGLSLGWKEGGMLLARKKPPPGYGCLIGRTARTGHKVTRGRRMVYKQEGNGFGYSSGLRRRGTGQFVLHMGCGGRRTAGIPRHHRAVESKGRVMMRKVMTKTLAMVRESPNEHETRIRCSLVQNVRVSTLWIVVVVLGEDSGLGFPYI